MKLLLGDCIEVMGRLEANSIDAIVTDPPYGLKFMNKGWDYELPNTDTWREVVRVLKPGGHLLAFGGTRTYHRLAVAIEDAGFEIRDQIQWLYGQGFPKSLNLGEGKGTALKPANEPIVLARKPLSEKTVAANVLKWGTGGLNIDACRIGLETRTVKSQASNQDANKTMGTFNPWNKEYKSVQGRFPANLIFDEEAARMLDEQSGITKSTGGGALGFFNNTDKNICMGDGRSDFYTPGKNMGKGDTGGASRFFYVAKSSKRERGEGNVHPTVKPIKLMEYLCKLITPPGGIILDPFMGSGTTGIAAKNLGFEFIGIEMNPEYMEIAKKRIGT